MKSHKSSCTPEGYRFVPLPGLFDKTADAVYFIFSTLSLSNLAYRQAVIEKLRPKPTADYSMPPLQMQPQGEKGQAALPQPAFSSV
jgi:hypothetical protein